MPVPLFMQDNEADAERDYYRLMEYEYELADNETGEIMS